jgi:hypothetical protein
MRLARFRSLQPAKCHRVLTNYGAKLFGVRKLAFAFPLEACFDTLGGALIESPPPLEIV